MHENLVRRLESRRVQHPRPEKAVEAYYVLPDEVVQFGFGVVPHVEAPEVLEARDVADRRVDPHIEELAGVSRYLETEVGRVARDAPPAQRLLEPLQKLVRNIARCVAGYPLLKIVVLGLELEVEMLGVAHDGRRAACCADGAAELLRAVCRAAAVAAVAVLVRRAALGACALDEPVGQEHAAVFAVELRR